MPDPWFEAAMYGWIPGTALGCLAGVWGSLVGIFARKGRGKAPLLGMGVVLLGFSLLCLVAGAVALAAGQPYSMWYGLGLGGLIGTLVLGFNLPVVWTVYRQAEERKLSADDL